jgi:hypothetical protein
MSKGMDTSRVVADNLPFIRFISVANSQQLEYLFHSSTHAQLKAVCEIVLNYQAGILTSSENFDLRRDLFKTLASKTVLLSRKRAILSGSAIYRRSVQKLLASVKI